MPNYLNPRTQVLLHEKAFSTPDSNGTTIYCWKAPAGGEITEINLLSNADLGAGTIEVKLMNGSSTIADHGTATAFTGSEFTTETLVEGTLSDGDTVHVVVVGDGTLDCTLTAQMTLVYGYPAAQG
jgi:hypothetical protein